MTAPIDAMIAAIEAGEVSLSVMQDLCIPIWPDGPQHWIHLSVSMAYDRGDMNAALALHAALLPGWPWWIESENAAEVCPRHQPEQTTRVYSDAGPARALLLATLKGYRATLENAK